MSRLSIAAAALLVVLPGISSAEPQRYELDAEHTTVAFLIDHVGYAATLGLFANVEGGFTYDMETQDLSDLEVRVMTASVETLNAARDEHVRSGDFLDVAEHEAMTFTANDGMAEGETSGTVTGDLTLLGETRRLTLDVTLNKAAEYPFGHGRFTLGITARGELNRSDFGMEYGVDNGLVGDTVRIIIETEAMRLE
ncbi:MAG: YceI family protein [Jannaschia sp.]